MKERILTYLAQGLKPAQVSSILGVSPGYISQLLSQEDFKESLKEARTVALKEGDTDIALTNKYTAVEHALLNAMEGQMAIAELPALARALEVIGTRQEKRAQRLAQPVGQNTNNQVVVNITLPSHAIPELSAPNYQLNAQREVVSVDNKTIAPLSSSGVKSLFAALIEEKKALALATSGTEF